MCQCSCWHNGVKTEAWGCCDIAMVTSFWLCSTELFPNYFSTSPPQFFSTVCFFTLVYQRIFRLKSQHLKYSSLQTSLLSFRGEKVSQCFATLRTSALQIVLQRVTRLDIVTCFLNGKLGEEFCLWWSTFTPIVCNLPHFYTSVKAEWWDMPTHK